MTASPEQMLEAAQRYVAGFYAQDRSLVEPLLSPGFGIHGGRDREAHIEHELWEYATREGHFGLMRGYEVLADAVESNSLIFSIRNADGWLVYRDVLCFDEAGLITGDQAPAEAIGKLRLYPGGSFQRVLVLHNLEREVQQVRLSGGLLALDGELLSVPQEEGGLTAEWRFRLEGDDGLNRFASFRLYSAGAPPVAMSALLPGRDHWAFRDDLFARIEDKAVTLPQGDFFLWHVQVQTVDGGVHDIELPKMTELRFEQPVARVVVTDALDHDWVSRT